MTTTNLLNPKPIPSEQLTYERANRRFVGEISDTRGFGRVWANACDEGLTLVSSTGRMHVFYVEREVRNHHDEIESWVLRSVEAIRNPCGPRSDLRVVLFND